LYNVSTSSCAHLTTCIFCIMKCITCNVLQLRGRRNFKCMVLQSAQINEVTKGSTTEEFQTLTQTLYPLIELL
jgi:hypothetical protein